MKFIAFRRIEIIQHFKKKANYKYGEIKIK